MVDPLVQCFVLGVLKDAALDPVTQLLVHPVGTRPFLRAQVFKVLKTEECGAAIFNCPVLSIARRFLF